MNQRPLNLSELRQRAEQALTRGLEHARHDRSNPSQTDLGQLVEELRIYQAELEIQNQELSAAQADIAHALGKYRRLYETLPLPAILLDAMGFIVEVNQEAIRQFRLGRMTTLNRLSVYQLFESGSRTALYAALQSGQTRSAHRLENLVLKTGSGQDHVFDVHIIHQAASGEGEAQDLLVLVDKNGERALRESEHRFRSFTDTSMTLIRATDATQKPDYYNRGWLEFIGLTQREALGADGWKSRLHPGESGRVLKTYADCFARRDVFRMDYRLRQHDGTYRWIRDEGVPREDSSGHFIGYIDHCQDITDLIEARQSLARLSGDLRLKEERLRLAMEATRDGLWDWNTQTGEVFCSPAYYRQLGYEPGELPTDIQSLWIDLMHPEEGAKTFAAARERLKSEGHYELEFRMRASDGRYRWIVSRGKVVASDASGQPLRAIGTHSDITERKLAELALAAKHAELLESNARLEKIASRIPGVVYQFELLPDGSMRLPYASEATRHIFQLAPERLQEDSHAVFALIHPDDIVPYRASIQESAQRLSPWQHEFRICRPDGSVRWLFGNATPERLPDGRVVWYGYTADITERKRVEEQLRELNASLEQKVAERTVQLTRASKAKSEFLANMSHEIRTPMNAILGLTQLLQGETLTPDQKDILDKITTAGTGLLHIINDILDFSKIEAGQLKIERHPFNLGEVLHHVETILEISAREKRLGLAIHAQEDLPSPLLGDPLRIKQVLVNLGGNAVKFTEQGGIDITVKLMAISAHGARLRFEVRDSGIGIEPEALAGLFQAFNQAEAGTTRRFGGTGLGLSISKRLVDLMGGEIGASSIPGQGSTFWFELPFPRASTDAAIMAPEPGPGHPKGLRLDGLRALVVDDNRINLFLLERALQREGAHVILAADGQQALQILKACPHGFDVVLMDIQMPVMDGLTATREIRSDGELAALPVIALTAGVMTEEREAAIAAGMTDFIAKPVDLEGMTQLLAAFCPDVRA